MADRAPDPTPPAGADAPGPDAADDGAVLTLFARCRGLPMPETLEARVRRAAAAPPCLEAPGATGPDAAGAAGAGPVAELVAAHRDDAWTLLLASLRDADLAGEALEDAFVRLEARRGERAAVPAGEALGAAREAAGAVWTHLRKTGHADLHPLGGLEDDARDLLLLRGLGAGLDDLRAAGVLAKDATPLDARAALGAAAAALVVTLPLPGHAGAGEQARRLAAAAVCRGDDLDPLPAAERAAAEAHADGCAPCAVLRERLAAAVDVPPRVCPLGAELAARVAERVARDRTRAAGVEAAAARIALACSYCHAPLVRAETVFCAACLAPHHGDCFRDHGRCSAPGCGERATVRAGRAAGPGGWRRLLAASLLLAAALGAGGLALHARAMTRLAAERGDLLAQERSRAAQQEQLELARETERLSLVKARSDAEARLDEAKHQLAELEALGRAGSPEERARLAAAQRDAQAAAARDEAAKLEALWAELRALAEARDVAPEALLAEARQSEAARLAARIDALFARVAAQAEAREVDDLMESFAALRQLLKEAEAEPSLRARVTEWHLRVRGLGEVSSAIDLQVYVTNGNAALRRLALAVADEDWDAVNAAYADAITIGSSLRSEQGEAFQRNAEALETRAQALLERARLVHRLSALRLDALDAAGQRATIGGRTLAVGDLVSGTEPAIRLVEVTATSATVEAGDVRRVLTPGAPPRSRGER